MQWANEKSRDRQTSRRKDNFILTFTRFIYTFHTDTYACPGSGKYLGSPCTVCSDQWGCPCGTPEWGCDGSCRTSSAVARCSCRTAPRRKDCSRSLPVSPGFEKCGRSRYSCCRKRNQHRSLSQTTIKWGHDVWSPETAVTRTEANQKLQKTGIRESQFMGGSHGIWGQDRRSGTNYTKKKTTLFLNLSTRDPWQRLCRLTSTTMSFYILLILKISGLSFCLSFFYLTACENYRHVD